MRIIGRWVIRAVAILLFALAVLIGLWAVLPPASTLMVGRWMTGRPVERIWLPLDRISPHLRVAVILSEDGQFCRHYGVDWQALGSVLRSAAGPTRGASTVTMQLVKNLYLWPSRSVLRKALEIPLALLIDLLWSKRRILEVYLNVAEWGDGEFGAEVAAQRAFAKSASALAPSEAALLATVLPNPRVRRAARPTRGQIVLSRVILARMERDTTAAACVLTGRG